MGNLVRDDGRHALLRSERRTDRVDEQAPLAKDDGAHVLHRAGREVRYGDDVELPERIPDAEVFVVEGELLLGCLECIGSQLELVRR